VLGVFGLGWGYGFFSVVGCSGHCAVFAIQFLIILLIFAYHVN